MVRRPPRSTRTDHTLSLHDALPIFSVRGDSVPPLTSAFLGFAVAGALTQMAGTILLIMAFGHRGFVVGTAFSKTEAIQVAKGRPRSEEHTSELQSLMRISYAVFCLKKKTQTSTTTDSLSTHI